MTRCWSILKFSNRTRPGRQTSISPNRRAGYDPGHHIADSDLLRIVSLADGSRDKLIKVEQSRLVHFTLPHLALWEFINYARMKESLDWNQWRGFERYFLPHFCAPVSHMRAIYQDFNTIWSEPFQGYIANVEMSQCGRQ